MMNSPRQHRHIGVYGVCILQGYMLLIRKARGPYTGQLGLPGGGIEFGEEPEDALRREFIEETGITILNPSLLRVASKQVRYIAGDGVVEELHHLGLIYSVSVAHHELLDTHGYEELPKVNLLPDGEDSGGAIWVRLVDIDADTLTPFARLAIPVNVVDM